MEWITKNKGHFQRELILRACAGEGLGLQLPGKGGSNTTSGCIPGGLPKAGLERSSPPVLSLVNRLGGQGSGTHGSRNEWGQMQTEGQAFLAALTLTLVSPGNVFYILMPDSS